MKSDHEAAPPDGFRKRKTVIRREKKARGDRAVQIRPATSTAEAHRWRHENWRKRNV